MDYWHIQESDFSEFTTGSELKASRDEVYLYLKSDHRLQKHAYSAISENQHGRERGSRFICFHAVKSKNNLSARCKILQRLKVSKHFMNVYYADV